MLITNFILRNESVRAEVLRSCLGVIVRIDAQELRRESYTNHFEADFTDCRFTTGGGLNLKVRFHPHPAFVALFAGRVWTGVLAHPKEARFVKPS